MGVQYPKWEALMYVRGEDRAKTRHRYYIDLFLLQHLGQRRRVELPVKSWSPVVPLYEKVDNTGIPGNGKCSTGAVRQYEIDRNSMLQDRFKNSSRP